MAADLKPGDVAWFDTSPNTIGLMMPDYAAVKTGRTIHRVNLSAVAFGWGT